MHHLHHHPTPILTLTLLILALSAALAAAVPPRKCDVGDVAPRARCENPDYEALEFTRGPGDRYNQCCERYAVYLARIEHLSYEELENSIRQW